MFSRAIGGNFNNYHPRVDHDRSALNKLEETFILYLSSRWGLCIRLIRITVSWKKHTRKQNMQQRLIWNGIYAISTWTPVYWWGIRSKLLIQMFAVNIVILAVADELYNNKQAKIGQVISIIVLPISKDISYLCYNFIWPVWSILVVFILSKAKEHYRYRWWYF